MLIFQGQCFRSTCEKENGSRGESTNVEESMYTVCVCRCRAPPPSPHHRHQHHRQRRLQQSQQDRYHRYHQKQHFPTISATY